MRLSIASALLALCPAVLGWHVTVYNHEDCNDHDGDFEYYIFEGEGGMDYGVGIEASEFPSNVKCSHYSQSGAVGPNPCEGQFDVAWSFTVVRGQAEFYEEYDTYSGQPIDRRCYGKLHNFGDTLDGDGSLFPADGCRNTYWHGDTVTHEKHQFQVKGLRAWEWEPQD
ncbi:hypothetical protein NM208_g2856 [Fusarium decemcellulare]|uniref:Uncharacterized protein n=1 Tax=Fusarium decemcellulare TaxID=57161 RepID=A0ACC1SR96_9HYPO|nr:hypothetical protein NM208_g2856 [Fusarium decemcellulare]